MATPSQDPQIRALQYDTEGIDGIQSCVNLFRGNVDYPVKLLSMPGRNGLDVSLVAMYQSNVEEQAQQWNLVAPTSVLGLGWDIPHEQILAVTNGTGAQEGHRYLFKSGSALNPLIRDQHPWLRFTIDATLSSSLRMHKNNVAHALPELLTAFAEQGMPLAEDIEIREDEAEQSWTLIDHTYARCFHLRQHESGLQVFAGGEAYQLQNFEFWRIHYYPETESWEITKNDGLTFLYGGHTLDTSRHSLQWGVSWNGWIGASNITHNTQGERVQQRYTTAWNLVEVRSKWHDTMAFYYDVVEQPVGKDGLLFTKACYLHKVVDVYGRTVEFVYAEKEYHDPLLFPLKPREYMDPYTTHPSTDPGPYQSIYSTRYLDALIIRNSDANVLFSLHFTYQLANVCRTADNTQGALYGDTFKRYLTGIIQRNAAGDELPGIRFDYYLDPVHDKQNLPGALQSITFPSGAVATFTYEEKSLFVCQRHLTVYCPEDWSGKAQTRVWFGPDYAVVIWYNADKQLLQLEVFTWLGYWQKWTPPAGRIVAFLDINELHVQAQAEFFALYYPSLRVEGNTYLYLYHKQITAQGDWFSSNEENEPLLFASKRLEIASGQQFLLVNDWNAHLLYRYTWDWSSRSWSGGQLEVDPALASAAQAGDQRYFITANLNYYVLLSYNRVTRANRFSLFYHDQTFAWKTGGTCDASFAITSINDVPQALWSPGASMAALSAMTNNSTSYFDYSLRILQWSPDYAQLTATHFSFSQQKIASEIRIGYYATLIHDTLIATGPNLLHFDGVNWQLNTQLKPTFPLTRENTFYFAYGDNLALMSQLTYDKIEAALDAYNPLESSATAWQPGRVLLGQRGGLPNTKRRYYPTIGGQGYFSMDTKVYHKTPLLRWDEVPAHPIYELDDAIDTTSIINQAPDYLSYMVLDHNNKPVRTDVVLFENGRVKKIESINEQYFVATKDGRAVAAEGRMFFTYPLDKTLSSTPQITLRRYVGQSTTQEVRSFVVKTCSVYDGYASHSTSYLFDERSAACDPSGQVLKFYRAEIFPGCERPEWKDGVPVGPSGSIEHIYLNGLSEENAESISLLHLSNAMTVRANQSLLDGFLIRKAMYNSDHQQVVVDATYYEIYNSLSPLPTPPQMTTATETLPLYGGYVRVPRSENKRDGVTNVMHQTFDPVSGNPRQTETISYNGDGEREQLITYYTYGYEVYRELHNWSLLNAVVQQKQTIRSGQGSEPVVVSVEATTWKNWSITHTQHPGQEFLVPGQDASYTLAQPQANSDFNFHGIPTTAWVRTSEILARNNAGLTTEMLDVEGQHTSMLYDPANIRVLAEFRNASTLANETSYYGFEPYEDASGWSLPAGCKIVSDEAYTGTSSARIQPGAQGPQRTFNLQGTSRSFLFTCWAKVALAPPEENVASSGWMISLSTAGAVQQSILLPFGAANGEWRFLMQKIDLTTQATRVQIDIQAMNHEHGFVWVDNLRFTPFQSVFRATVYDELFNAPLAELGIANDTVRYWYDPWHAPVGASNAAGIPTNLAIGFLSRQMNTTFDANSPNYALALTTQADGFYEDLCSNDGWQKHWTAQPADAWRVEDHVLRHIRGSDVATLTLEHPYERDIALYLNLELPADKQITSELGLKIAERFIIRWNPDDKHWEAFQYGERLTTLAQTQRQQPQKEWLLIASPHVLLFYADGALIVRYVSEPDIVGPLQIFTNELLGLTNIALLAQPQVSVNFQDGAGRNRQTQSLGDSEYVISGNLYDQLARGVLSTKAAAFPVRPTEAFFSYRQTFITGMDWISGIMEGDIADYYTGQDGRADDQGYPYTRVLYENSPLSRVIEQGAPGKDFAIVNLNTTVPEQRHTIKTRYATNDEHDIPVLHLPADQYFKTTKIDANGTVSVQLATRLGDIIATCMYLTEDNTIVSATRTFFVADGVISQQLLPNAFDQAGETTTEWQTETKRNLLNQITTYDAPDSGQQRFIYDQAGRLRFFVHAQAIREDYLLYAKYDTIGRLTEGGALPAAWDEKVLQRYAFTQPDFPTQEDGAQPYKLYSYDGDGTVAQQLGRLQQTITYGEQGQDEVIEWFLYDQAGRITAKGQRVPAYDAHDYRTEYGYDPQGSLRQITYIPDDQQTPGVSIRQVSYTYNRLGNLSHVNVAGMSRPLASYTYDANGAPLTELLAVGQTDIIQHTFRYTSPGWLQEHRYAQLFDERFEYTSNGYQGGGYFDGKIAALHTSLQIPTADSFPTNYSYAYSYDPIGRLQVAQHSTNSAWDLAINAYDANSNILSVQQNGNERIYRYTPGSDEVTNTLGGDHHEYQYEPTGNVTLSQPAHIEQITYHPLTRTTTSIQAKAKNITTSQHFLYNSNDQRVFKRSDTDDNGDHTKTRLYVSGLQTSPLFVLDAAQGQIQQSTQYIYGPLGPLAVQVNDQQYLLIRDRENSTRMLLNSATAEIVQAFHYKPFGDFMGEPFGGSIPLMPYLYTGQEYDQLAESLYLYNFKARFYDQHLYRFYGIDPADQFFSPYLFVGNDPINYQDASGDVAILAVALAVGISALIGTVAGGIAYEVNRRQQGESFDGSKLALYAAVGGAAGALGGLAGYGAGAAIGGALAVAVPTYSIVGTGIVVGAVSGVVDGAVSGAVSQLGYNLIEGKSGLDAFSGVGTQIVVGGALGGLFGGGAGRVAGRANAPVGARLARPNKAVSVGEPEAHGEVYRSLMGISPDKYFRHADNRGKAKALKLLLNKINKNEVGGLSAHGFADGLGSADNAVTLTTSELTAIAKNYREFAGIGLDMRAVCSVGKSLAPRLARAIQKPILAAESITYVNGVAITTEKFHAFHIYYPSRLQTAWARIFGY